MTSLYLMATRRRHGENAGGLRSYREVQKHLSVYAVSKELKREQNSLYNCISSVVSDTSFVSEIRQLYPTIPLLANLRCGLWYCRQPDGTCYFKSTDGHQNNWSFSTTRLNWNVAELAASRGGVVIVDATRKGKRFPVSDVKPARAQQVESRCEMATPRAKYACSQGRARETRAASCPCGAANRPCALPLSIFIKPA